MSESGLAGRQGNQNYRLENRAEQQERLQRQMTWLQIISSAANLPVWVGLAIFTGLPALWLAAGFSAVLLGGFSASFWLCRHKQVNFSVYTSLTTLIVVVTAFFFLLGAHYSNIGISYVLSAEIALLMLGLRSAIVCTIAGAILTGFIVLGEQVFGFYQPLLRLDAGLEVWVNLFLAEMIIGLIFALLLVLYLNMQRTNRVALWQGEQLETTLEALEQRQADSTTVAQKVLSTASQLNATAAQQTSSASQQVRAVNEVTTALQELSSTARQIADSAGRVEVSAGKMLNSARQVQQTASDAASGGADGQRLVQGTVNSIVEVGRLYHGLVETMLNLSANAKDIRKVLQLIKSIADETHLLALNAAIEAAGAGEYGARFSVVAQEVKSLANRALQANREVGELVQRVEESVVQAVQAAENGQHRVGEAVAMAKQSGEVIGELATVTHQAAEETAAIASLSQEVKQMAEEIGLATRQQQNAGEQVLEVLSEVVTMAQQTSSSSAQLAETASTLEVMSLNLQTALTA